MTVHWISSEITSGYRKTQIKNHSFKIALFYRNDIELRYL